MDPGPDTNSWLVFENEAGSRTAEYGDFDEQVELSDKAAAEHHEFVTRVSQEFGFTLPTWTPTIPSRSKSLR